MSDVAELCWCESTDGAHDERCDLAPVDMTKGELVELLANTTAAVVGDYLGEIHMRDLPMVTGPDTPDPGPWPEPDSAAVERAAEQQRESLRCFLGLGSCGGGGCKHS
jgi:hypothetical protein